MSLELHFIATPDAGAVIDHIEVGENTIRHRDFTQCLLESAPLVNIEPPEQAREGTFRVKWTAGTALDNAKSFASADNADLWENNADFLRVLARDEFDGTATDLHAVIAAVGTDAALSRAFGEWVERSGLELGYVAEEE